MKPPSHLSVLKSSPFYDPCCRYVIVFFNGEKRPGDVQEYDTDEGWIVIQLRNGRGHFRVDDFGNFVTERLEGRVEVRFAAHYQRVLARARAASYVPPVPDHAEHLRKAAEKRERKNAKRRQLHARD